MTTQNKSQHVKHNGTATGEPLYKTNFFATQENPDNCLCENKGADQLRGNREADQRLCFRYSDSTVPPLLNSKISSF